MTLPLTLRIALTPPQAVAATAATLWPGSRAPAVILAHGAGTTQLGIALRTVAEGIAADGHSVATFDFAYTAAGRRRPDPTSRLLSAWRDVIAAVRWEVGDDRPLVLGGRSMGGRMASMLAAEDPKICDGLLMLGYPLHAAGRPDRIRTAHWPELRAPILFVQGDRDALCPLDALERERAAHLAHAEVHVVAGADHGFNVRKIDGRRRGDVLAEVTQASLAWLARLPARR